MYGGLKERTRYRQIDPEPADVLVKRETGLRQYYTLLKSRYSYLVMVQSIEDLREIRPLRSGGEVTSEGEGTVGGPVTIMEEPW